MDKVPLYSYTIDKKEKRNSIQSLNLLTEKDDTNEID